MAGRNPKPNPGFDPAEKVNSNTLKRHPKMDLSRNDLLQLLTYLEGELQARDIAIATLKAEKAKQLLFQAKYGRFGLGDPFSAMQRDSDNMKDTTFDESAIKSMYDNQLAQLENLIATQRKAQMKMREQMLAGEKRYQKVCSELDEEKKKHAQDTAQGDDVTYMLEKERERLRQEVEFEKGSVKKMEKDMKKTLASLEEERASSVKHKQVALMLIKERKKLVEKYVVEKQKADLAEKVLSEERSKSMNMAEGLVQESKKSLKMEATMERQASEFDLEREQLKNKLHREENRNKELAAQIEELTWKLDNIHKQKPSSLKEGVHTVEIKSTIHSPPIRLSSEKSGWSSPSTSTLLSTKPGNIVEREAGLSPRNSSSEMSVRKHDNTRYASPHGASVERGQVHQYADHIEQRVAPVGAVADSNKVILDSGHKLSVSLGGPTVVSSGGRITVQTSSPPISSGQVSPRRMLSINRGTPPPIPPNKPILPATTSTTASVGATTKPFSSTQQKVSTMRDGRPAGSKPVHIPVSVVHTTSISSPPTSRATKHEGSPSSLRKPAQLSDAPVPPNTSHDPTPPTSSESFDFLGQEMADLQQLLVSMVSVSPDTPGVDVKSYRSNPGSNNDVIIPSTAMTSSDYNMTSLNSAVMSSDSVMTSSHSMTSSVPEVTSAITTLVSSEPDASNFRTNVNKKNEQSEATTSLITSQMQALSVETEQNTPRGAYSMSASSQSPSVIATASLSPRPQNNTVVQSESSPPSQFYDSSPLPSSSSSSSSSSQSSAVPSSYQSITHSSSSKSNDFQVPTPKHDHTDSYTTKIAVHQNGSVSLPQTASPIVQATFPMSDKQNEDQSWYSWGVVHGKQTEVTLSPSVPGPIPSAKLGSPASTDYVRKSVDSASASLGRAISAQQSQGNLDLPTSPIHRFAAMGNVEGLHKLIVELEADVNLPMKDGTTPAHCAAERGQEGCLRLLLQRGCHVNCLRDDQQTPLHCATVAGHTGCLQLLLENGSNPHLADYAGWTPLHWAAFKGYRDGCRILLVCGASQLAVSNTNWTPVHLAVHSDRPEIVDLLLTYQSRNQSESLLQVRKAVCEIVDKDEMTLAHMAAMKESPECLSVICCHCDIDVNQVDKWGRSVIDVSSNSCRHILQPYALASQMRYLKVQIQCTGPLYNQYEPYVIGQIELHPRMHWGHVAGALHNCAEEYFSQLDHGLRTKKVSRLDPDSAVDDSQYSLGFSYQSIACFQLGNLTWTLAIDSYPKVKLPVVLSTLQNPVATILLKGSTNDCESLAFDLLLPVVFFQSLTRLMEQYKAVMFYGPEGTRKKYLVTRLAKHLAEKERQTGTEPMVSQMYLHSDFKHRDFVHFLTSEGCLLPVGVESECSRILVLYGLEKVQFSDMLGSLTQHIDHRGGQHSFPVPGLGGTQELCYFPDNFYLIGTMDKPRSTGLDLNVQQRFRWVYFPVKNEPIRNLLGRHFLRRLLHIYGGKMPSAEDDVFKVIEWIVCVWQRLNDGVNKLGLPDIVFGPNIFMTCPLETGNAQVILNWLRVVWNEAISPVVRVGVSKGTGKDGGQQKVSNTALYVLMQRAIVPGCPLAGKDKDNYLQGFSGTNELEVPLTGKSDRWSPNPASSTTSPQRRSLHNGHQQENNRAINRHSTGSPANVPFIQQNYNNNNNSAFKRRSLSDNTLQQHDRIEIPVVHEQTSDQPANLQAKVPKLEIRSPVLGLPVSLPLPFPTNNGSSQHSKHARSTLHPSHRHDNTPTSHQRRSVSTVHSKIPQPSKRSKSSENLASTIPIPIIHHTTSRTQGQNVSQGQNQLATSPFTFSLASTTPSLFSFKTYDHRRNSGAGTSKSRSLTSSPTSLLYPQSGGKR